MRHINIYVIIGLLIALLLVNSVSAFTAAYQKCKAVIYPTIGESIENCVKVINRNDEQIRIEISAEGDIKDDFEFLENNITLEAGEEKKVYYNVKPVKAGTSEMKILIKFIPEVGNAIILPTELTVIASSENSEDDSNNDDSDDTNIDNVDDDSNGVNNTNNNANRVNVRVNGNSNTDNNNNNDDKKLSPYVPLIITSGILLIILIILIIVGRKPKQNQENKSIESNEKNDLYKESKNLKSNKLNKKKRPKGPNE